MKYIKMFEEMQVDDLPFPKMVIEKLKKDIMDIKQMLVDIYGVSDDSRIVGVYRANGSPGFLMTVKFKNSFGEKGLVDSGELVTDRVVNMLEEIITLRGRLSEIGYRLRVKFMDQHIKLSIELI